MTYVRAALSTWRGPALPERVCLVKGLGCGSAESTCVFLEGSAWAPREKAGSLGRASLQNVVALLSEAWVSARGLPVAGSVALGKSPHPSTPRPLVSKAGWWGSAGVSGFCWGCFSRAPRGSRLPPNGGLPWLLDPGAEGLQGGVVGVLTPGRL